MIKEDHITFRCSKEMRKQLETKAKSLKKTLGVGKRRSPLATYIRLVLMKELNK